MSDGEQITPEHVRLAYRLFLNREPESQDVIYWHMKASDIQTLRENFLQSPEFKSLYKAPPETLPLVPRLRQEHVANALLCADRICLIQALAPRLKGGAIAEIGVAFGDFSALLIRELAPREFHAFDVFTIHRAS